MATQVQTPILITLTSPSAAGKSYLFNHIRDVAKLPCLISTTTRNPRASEKEGIDYFFISEEESLRLENENLLAELAIYNGVRYGVTKEEFKNKLSQGIAFLICEPTGIDHYIQPALDIGALSYKTYIHTDPEVRLRRFRDRAEMDMLSAANIVARDASLDSVSKVMREFNTSLNRLTTMLTQEMQWGDAHQWDRVLMGTDTPEHNLAIILADVKKIQDHAAEVAEFAWPHGDNPMLNKD